MGRTDLESEIMLSLQPLAQHERRVYCSHLGKTHLSKFSNELLLTYDLDLIQLYDRILFQAAFRWVNLRIDRICLDYR